MIPVLDPKGPQAARIFELGQLFFWLGLTVFVLVMVFIAIPIFMEKTASSTVSEKSVLRAIIIAVSMSCLILWVLLIKSFLTGREFNRLGDKTLSVKVTGHQWWWEINYDDQVAQN